MARLSSCARELYRATDQNERVLILERMKGEVESVRTVVGSGFAVLRTFGAALGRLFTVLAEDVERVNVSSLRTISHAIDFLSQAAPAIADGELEEGPLRVLVVDDEPICRRTLMLALRNSEIELTVSETGEQALQILGEQPFDVIFSDVMMPGLDGFGLAAELRKLPKHTTTPVIFVTTLSDFTTRSRSIMSGVCDLIGKPFTVSEIVVKAFTFGLKHRFAGQAQTKPIPAQNGGESGPRNARAEALEMDLASPAEGEVVAVSISPSRLPATVHGVLCIESDGRIKSINQDGAAIFGSQPSGLVGCHLSTLFPDELQAEGGLRLNDLATQGFSKPQRASLTGRRQDGSPVALSATISETNADNKRQYILLFRPVSDPTPSTTPAAPPPAAGSNRAEENLPISPAASQDSNRIEEASLPVVPEPIEASSNLAKAVPASSEPATRTSPEPAPQPKVTDTSEPVRSPELKTADHQDQNGSSDSSPRERLEHELAQFALKAEEWQREQMAFEELLRTESESRERVSAQLTETQQAREQAESKVRELLAEVSELRKGLEEGKRAAALAEQRQLELQTHLNEAARKQSSTVSPPPQDATGEKLSAARLQLKQESAQRRHLETRVRELELARTELTRQTVSSNERDQLSQRAIQSLQTELAQARGRLEKETQKQVQRETELKDQCAVLELKAQALEEGLAQSHTRIEGLESAQKTATAKLAEVRHQFREESSHRQRLESHVRELELAKSELTRQAEASLERDQLWQQTIQSLKSELGQARALLEREIQEQVQRETKLKEQCAALELQSQALEESLAQTQSELDQQTAQRAAAEQRAGELATVRSSLEQQVAEDQRIQERLRQDLATLEQRQQAEAARFAQERRQFESALDDLREAEVRKARETRMELASLRYGILDTCRARLQLGNNYSQSVRQHLDRLGEIATALFNTPLSTTQRQLANALRHTLETCAKDSLEGSGMEQADVESLVLQNSDFGLEQTVNDAFQVIQMTAGNVGASAHLAVWGVIPDPLHGDSAHLYQLLTLLGNGLLHLPEAKSLDLQISVDHDAQRPELQGRFTLHTNGRAHETGELLTDVASRSSSLRLAKLGDTESSLATSWQLAAAMGGVPEFEVSGDTELTVRLAVPLENAAATPAPAHPA
jgi:PAS domain S-box-containing protein